MTGEADRVAWAHDLRHALNALDADEQLFLRLSYFSGLDHARIADRAGTTLAAVSRTIATALQHLAQALELSATHT